MHEFLTDAIFPVVSSFLTGLATFFFTRRKYVAEARGTEIENMKKSLEFYIDLVEDNKKRIDDYQQEIEELRKSNSELRHQLQELSLQLINKSLIQPDNNER
jgi:cell shape-determining protein MreC